MQLGWRTALFLVLITFGVSGASQHLIHSRAGPVLAIHGIASTPTVIVSFFDSTAPFTAHDIGILGEASGGVTSRLVFDVLPSGSSVRIFMGDSGPGSGSIWNEGSLDICGDVVPDGTPVCGFPGCDESPAVSTEYRDASLSVEIGIPALGLA